MDHTLAQILGALIDKTQEVTRLQQRLAELEAALAQMQANQQQAQQAQQQKEAADGAPTQR